MPQAHTFQMERDRLADQLLGFFSRLARCDTARKVRYIGRPVSLSFLKNHCVLGHSCSSPACFQMLYKVFGCTSSLGWPLTVTMPAFVA